MRVAARWSGRRGRRRGWHEEEDEVRRKERGLQPGHALPECATGRGITFPNRK